MDDYLGIRNAIVNYTTSGIGYPTIKLSESMAVTSTKLGVCREF
ncbi:hypothetical protein [Vibrio harveyi]